MKQIIEKLKSNYKLLLIVLVIGTGVGVLLGSSINTSTHQQINTSNNHQHADEASGEGKAEEDQTWTCSMHPQIKQDEPGQCPICGMDLIPLSSTESDDEQIDPDHIQMTASAKKLADIQTTVVRRRSPKKTLYLQGKVHPDERRISELTARFGGRIEKLFISFTGQNVKKGEKLATIYSPELVTAQRELLEAAKAGKKQSALFTAAKAKLKLWDLNENQISNILEQEEPIVYFDVRSPISGTVMHRNVSVGEYVKEGQHLFKVMDLTHVWVMFDAYESDLSWISVGDPVNFSVKALPGKKFKGEVSYIDPFINKKSRVAKIRVEMENPGMKLKPEMFVQGKLHSSLTRNSKKLLIPKTSVLWTGKRSIVYIKVPDADKPVFEYREIELGPETGDSYVVAEGLSEGEKIVTNGVFKIDAAAQLAGKPSMMNPGGGQASTGHNHGQKDMEMEESHDKTVKIDKSQIDSQFRNQLTAFYKTYLGMKDAFVASDAEKVNNRANKLQKKLDEIDMSLLKGDAHMQWMDHLNAMKTQLTAIASTNDLKKQRQAFIDFNPALYKAVEQFGLSGETAYYQYCPMANSNEGAYWLSNEEQIRNPYYGDQMLTCGEVRKVIKE